MKAAIVNEAGRGPVYGEFAFPVAGEGEELITVRAAALSQHTKSKASGSHYSSSSVFPAVAGTDGVGIAPDGRRVYFVNPEAPYGSLAQFCPVHTRRMVEVPESVDDITAAAIGNPGMSAWAGLVERAQLAAGETVLVNGATSTAGRLAVQLAKHLGAARVIATGRNVEELGEVKELGADVVIPFRLDAEHPEGAAEYEQALVEAFSPGIDVVIDYVWGQCAKTVMLAMAETIEDNPARFVHVGSTSGEMNIELPGSALRSSAITLMGSGVGSVSRPALVRSIRSVFEAVGPAGLKIATTPVPLADVAGVWEKATGKPRVVFTIG